MAKVAFKLIVTANSNRKLQQFHDSSRISEKKKNNIILKCNHQSTSVSILVLRGRLQVDYNVKQKVLIGFYL